MGKIIFESVYKAREAIYNEKSTYYDRIKTLTKLFPTNVKEGKYKISRLSLLQQNSIDNYCVLIKNVGYYPIINFVDGFIYDDIISYIDSFKDKDYYKNIVENFITSFLCCAICKNDSIMFNKIISRVLYHSTNNGEFLNLGFRNISLAQSYIGDVSSETEQFLFKKNLLVLNFYMTYPKIVIPRSTIRHLVQNVCRISFKMKPMYKNIFNRAISTYREHLIDEHNSRRQIYADTSFSETRVDEFFDIIESDIFALKNIISECEFGWFNSSAKEIVQKLSECDSERFLNACINYFNSNVRRCYEKEKARIFIALNDSFPDLDCMANILPKISENLQTQILAAMI